MISEKEKYYRRRENDRDFISYDYDLQCPSAVCKFKIKDNSKKSIAKNIKK